MALSINRGWLIVARVALGIVVATGLAVWRHGFESNNARASVASAVDQKTALLNLKPRTVELPSEKARRVRDAIVHQDYATANKITADVLAASHLESWRFYPFADFMDTIADPDDPTFEAGLSAWVAHDAGAAMPLVVRAKYYSDTAWAKRGHEYTSKTPGASLESFGSYTSKALTDVEAAIHLDARNPYEFYLRLDILHGLGASKAVADAFDDAVARYPDYYDLYQTMLATLEPKWGGDVPAMYAFVDRYAGSAGANSPLKLLYVELYRDLLETAATACDSQGQDNDKLAGCISSVMQNVLTPELENALQLALQLYDQLDKYRFGVALKSVLSDMLNMKGGDTYAGAVLEMVATSLGSNTQLKESNPGNNNYVIDELVALSWSEKGFYQNALQKDQEALQDVRNTAFPDEEERDLAVAGVLEHAGRAYNGLGQTTDMIAYEQAAMALGDKTEWERYICYGYYRLKDYEDAIRLCTKAIDDAADGMAARYWRGAAYRDKGDADAALKDLTVVAGSDNSLRSSAAIDMSMIHFGRNDNRSALDVLNRYEYLYDPDKTGRDDVAVSYNNRCCAYMQLGELKKALDDCTASLKYGAIPDAYSKQLELIRRLSVPEARS